MAAKITTVKARCKGCGICVSFCPKHILELDGIGKIQVKDETGCILCGQCELRCPDYAIYVEKRVEA